MPDSTLQACLTPDMAENILACAITHHADNPITFAASAAAEMRQQYPLVRISEAFVRQLYHLKYVEATAGLVA